MKRYISIILSVILLFVLSCTGTNQITLNNDNQFIEDANQIQLIYFDLIKNPDYYYKYPDTWDIYSIQNINRAKQLYNQKYNNEL